MSWLNFRKLNLDNFSIIFSKPLDKITLLCYIIFARCERDWFADYLSWSIQTYPSPKAFEKISNFFPKPLDKHRILCYNQSVNKREGWLFRTGFLGVVSFPIWHLVYIPPFERRLVVLPVGFYIGLLSMRRGKTCDDVERIHTHCKKRKRLLAVDRHWRLGTRRVSFLSSSSSTVWGHAL